jgi:hypothetical protein
MLRVFWTRQALIRGVCSARTVGRWLRVMLGSVERESPPQNSASMVVEEVPLHTRSVGLFSCCVLSQDKRERVMH